MFNAVAQWKMTGRGTLREQERACGVIRIVLPGIGSSIHHDSPLPCGELNARPMVNDIRDTIVEVVASSSITQNGTVSLRELPYPAIIPIQREAHQTIVSLMKVAISQRYHRGHCRSCQITPDYLEDECWLEV